MRAAVFTGAGRPMTVEQLEIDGPQSGEVGLTMLASGVCRSDLHVLDGDWAVRRRSCSATRGSRRSTPSVTA